MPRLRRTEIKTRPITVERDRPTPRRLQISTEIAELLRTVADTTDDDNMRAALLRLAGHAPS